MATNQTISLQISNNTTSVQTVNVMSSPYAINSNLNALTEYRYDISSLVLTNENSFNLLYRNALDSSFKSYSANFTGGLNGLLIALNNFGISNFYIETVGGNTYLSTNNDDYVFSDLNIYFGSLVMLYDFYLQGNYSNINTSIPDISQNNFSAYPTLGTGLGTQLPIGSTSISYQTVPFGYLNINSQTGVNQYSVQINNVAKFPNNSPYTIIVWFTNTNTTFGTDVFQGLVSAEGRDSGQRTGYNFYISNSGGFNIGHTRFELNTGNYTLRTVNFPSFVANQWYCAIAGYDGSNMYTALFDGTLHTDTFASSYALENNPLFAAYIGLRYNNWLNGNIGYVAIYSEWAGFTYINDIIAQTKSRYGY